ncbi:MAG: ribonuclease III [Eubacteriales bacterium]|nr:ribonuclease III [Eubacteriales bacterium]
MTDLEKKIGYVFKNKDLLRTALTHSSYANERRTESYERMEFLGDSVLGFVTAEFLFSHEPPVPEGKMSRLRSELVCEQNLHKVAEKLGISGSMLLGRGEEKSGGRERVSVLADMVEAIIAAIYLDSGIVQAKEFIYAYILNDADLSEYHSPVDSKTILQELVQRQSDCSIAYEEVMETGPDHNKLFTFRVVINGVPAGEGSGRTKKEAEQAAAAEALKVLTK